MCRIGLSSSHAQSNRNIQARKKRMQKSPWSANKACLHEAQKLSFFSIKPELLGSQVMLPILHSAGFLPSLESRLSRDKLKKIVNIITTKVLNSCHEFWGHINWNSSLNNPVQPNHIRARELNYTQHLVIIKEVLGRYARKPTANQLWGQGCHESVATRRHCMTLNFKLLQVQCTEYTKQKGLVQLKICMHSRKQQATHAMIHQGKGFQTTISKW